MQANQSSGINWVRSFGVVTAIMLFVACSSMPPIATDVDYEYGAGAAAIKIFRVEFVDVPEFLKPMLRDEVSIVLAGKGLDYTEGDAQGILQMSFVQRPLMPIDSDRDDYESSVLSGGGTRFIGEIHVEMRNSVTQERIWSGVLSRYHNVTLGSYMHEVPAREAMRAAFTQLFLDYPNPTIE